MCFLIMDGRPCFGYLWENSCFLLIRQIQRWGTMRQSVRSFLLAAVVVSVGVLGFGNAQSAVASVGTVTLLDRGEPFEGMTAHAGLLWIGKSRENFSSVYSLEVYNKKDLVGKVTFPHSATYVHPYGANSVIVIGTGYQPNLTQYTIMEHRQGQFTKRTVQIPINAWARQWLGTHGGREYFTDPGGNPADSDNPNFNQPAQTFFTMSAGGSPRYLSTRLRLPLGGVKIGQAFFVYNAESIGDPRSNIYRLDPASASIKKVLPEFRNGLAGMAVIPGTSFIAATERGAQQLIVVDTNSSTVVGTAPINGEPRSVTSFGKCMIVGSWDTRVITAVDVSTPAAPVVVGESAIDLNQNDFYHIDRVAADISSGQVFARSNFPCNPMIDVCDKDWNRVVVLTGDDAQKFVSACR